ncbi:MAG: hypothetical protein KF819_08290 [Labilithrix sp.]|nr:hypothetical protein [Labilithrix sp.]
MSHPSNIDLEAFACGDAVKRVEAHLADCAACRAFVEKLRGFVEAETPAREEVDAIVARARTTPRKKMWVVASSVVAPLAIAAAALLVLRTPERPREESLPAAEPLAAATIEPETTFKGGVTVAVVREREGAQARFSSAVKVKPDDRLRVEVALDREQAILGAVLSDDGKWLELMPEGVRGPGTHFSEKSARIDGAPTRGTIVVGAPEAVQRARETKRFEGVTTMRVEWEGAP